MSDRDILAIVLLVVVTYTIHDIYVSVFLGFLIGFL